MAKDVQSITNKQSDMNQPSAINVLGIAARGDFENGLSSSEQTLLHNVVAKQKLLSTEEQHIIYSISYS